MSSNHDNADILITMSPSINTNSDTNSSSSSFSSLFPRQTFKPITISKPSLLAELIITATPIFIGLDSTDFSTFGLGNNLIGNALFSVELLGYALLIFITLHLRSIQPINDPVNSPVSATKNKLACYYLFPIYFILTTSLLRFLNVYLLPKVKFSCRAAVWPWKVMSLIVFIGLFILPLILHRLIPQYQRKNRLLILSYFFLLSGTVLNIFMLASSLDYQDVSKLMYRATFYASIISGIILGAFMIGLMIYKCTTKNTNNISNNNLAEYNEDNNVVEALKVPVSPVLTPDVNNTYITSGNPYPLPKHNHLSDNVKDTYIYDNTYTN